MTHAPIDTRDDVELDAHERIAFWAIAQHADDEVPCNAPGVCPNEARWMYRCPNGHEFARCDTDRAALDAHHRSCQLRSITPVCGYCCDAGTWEVIPVPAPWLPM